MRIEPEEQSEYQEAAEVVMRVRQLRDYQRRESMTVTGTMVWARPSVKVLELVFVVVWARDFLYVAIVRTRMTMNDKIG